MVNFPHSTFTWKSRPIAADPHYKRTGFVGTPGQVHHVRFNLEARCEIRESIGGKKWECFLGAPCRTEYTIAERNLFQVPSNEWRIAVSRDSEVSSGNGSMATAAFIKSGEPDGQSTGGLRQKEDFLMGLSESFCSSAKARFMLVIESPRLEPSAIYTGITLARAHFACCINLALCPQPIGRREVHRWQKSRGWPPCG